MNSAAGRSTSAFAAVASSSQSQQSKNRHRENNVAFRKKKNKRTGAPVCASVRLVTNSPHPGEALISFGLPAVPPPRGYRYSAAVASGVIIAAR